MRVALYGGAVFLGFPAAFSQLLVHPVRQPAERVARGFEEIHLIADGLRLRAWLARGNTERPAVVVVHGLGDSLESYQEHAVILGRRGHTVLLLDLRGHGGSEGRSMTLGGLEREDVRAAVAYLQAQGLARSGLALFGASMGAVAVLRAAADRDDVRAVVVEAPFDTYRDTVAQHAKAMFGMPRWIPLIPITVAIAEWRAGFDADDLDAVAAARRIHAPLLAIADGADRRMPEPVVRRVFDAHPGPKQMWVAPGAEHVGAILHPDYWPTVLGFLEKNGVSPPALPAKAAPTTLTAPRR